MDSQETKLLEPGSAHFMTQRSAEAPSVVSHLSLSSGSPLATARVRAGGESDPRLRRGGGVELRRCRLAGGDGDRRRALTAGEGDLASRLTGESARLPFPAGDGDLALRLRGGDIDLLPCLAGDVESLLRLTGDSEPLPRRTGDKDLRSTSYLGAESIMTESPE